MSKITKKMKNRKNKLYDADHKLAKFIVANIIVILVTIAQASDTGLALILNAVAVYIWFFGINPMAYLIETIRKHPHQHDKL